MKIQHLAIIFVIIIVPISMVVTSYIQTQIDTIALQTTYDAKLQTATADAINVVCEKQTRKCSVCGKVEAK